MLTDRDLKEILDFSSPASVLSVYLNTDPHEGNTEALKLRLRRLVGEVNLPEDRTAVLEYFEHAREWKGRSMAIFSCARRAFFRAYPLAVPLRSQARTGDAPYVKPLADLLDAYGAYGVVLVDKLGARLFLFHLGELIEQEGVLGETVRHTKRGGTADQTRHTEELADRNARGAADFAVHFFEQSRVRRILIGGTDENVSRFRHHLPKGWQSLVVGTFPMDMTARSDEVLARALAIGRQAQAAREARLVAALLTQAAKGSGGVLRLDETLGAVRDGRVQTLFIQDGYRAPGCRCPGCGTLTAGPARTCPFCGAGLEPVDDAVELAVRAVMQAGGDVEVVRGQPALDQVGVGAMLRY